MQPLAERFRDTCGVDPAYVANFGEEVARGQPVFIMGQLLKFLEPMLRETAEVAPWQVCFPLLYSACASTLALFSSHSTSSLLGMGCAKGFY